MRIASLLLLVACTQATVQEPAVVLDPGAIDLGPVYPGQLVQRSVVVADVRDLGGDPRVDEVFLVGDQGTELSLTGPDLPADLDLSQRFDLTTTAVGRTGTGEEHRAELVVRGTVDGEPYELRGDVTWFVRSCDEDLDGADAIACGGRDCDDGDPARFPGNVESCNGIDDDCSGVIDDAEDADGDGWTVCDDCDDDDRQVHPDAPEVCNGLDDDCDGWLGLDEEDLDGDGYAVCDGDCDDGDDQIHPDAVELCDAVDNDCDGRVDDFSDEDGDGVDVCTDCDDDDDTVFPGAVERCDGLDNDCDGRLGELEVDRDGDGFFACDDCEDTDELIHPDAEEACNGVDDNCNFVVDEADTCPCDREEFLGHVYQFCDGTFARNWGDARRTCQGWGYDMVTLDSGREDAWVFGTATDIDDERWWIGFNDLRREGVWVWEDGTRVTYTNWNAAEPNDTGSGEDCGQINRYSDGSWNDEPCRNALPFVCELD